MKKIVTRSIMSFLFAGILVDVSAKIGVEATAKVGVAHVKLNSIDYNKRELKSTGIFAENGDEVAVRNLFADSSRDKSRFSKLNTNENRQKIISNASDYRNSCYADSWDHFKYQESFKRNKNAFAFNVEVGVTKDLNDFVDLSFNVGYTSLSNAKINCTCLRNAVDFEGKNASDRKGNVIFLKNELQNRSEKVAYLMNSSDVLNYYDGKRKISDLRAKKVTLRFNSVDGQAKEELSAFADKFICAAIFNGGSVDFDLNDDNNIERAEIESSLYNAGALLQNAVTTNDGKILAVISDGNSEIDPDGLEAINNDDAVEVESANVNAYDADLRKSIDALKTKFLNSKNSDLKSKKIINDTLKVKGFTTMTLGLNFKKSSWIMSFNAGVALPDVKHSGNNFKKRLNFTTGASLKKMISDSSSIGFDVQYFKLRLKPKNDDSIDSIHKVKGNVVVYSISYTKHF